MSRLFENDQQVLISALKKGDRKAFSEIYQQFSQGLFEKLQRLVRSEKVAEELLQQLFVKLWIKKESITIESNLVGYLNKMAANLAYDYFRKAAKEQKARAAFLSHFDAVFDPTAPEEDPSLALQELDQLLSTLPPQRKKVLELCKIQGKSYKETGILLGISVSTVNDHIVKATRFLRNRLLENKSLNVLWIIIFICA